MPPAKLPKKLKRDRTKPKKSRILIENPIKSKIHVRKQKKEKILMPEKLRAHMLEQEANRLYMRDMKTKNKKDKTEDKTEVHMFEVSGIPIAQRLNLLQIQKNKPNKARVHTVNGVPVTNVPVIGVPVTMFIDQAGKKAAVVQDGGSVVQAQEKLNATGRTGTSTGKTERSTGISGPRWWTSGPRY